MDAAPVAVDMTELMQDEYKEELWFSIFFILDGNLRDDADEKL